MLGTFAQNSFGFFFTACEPLIRAATSSDIRLRVYSSPTGGGNLRLDISSDAITDQDSRLPVFSLGETLLDTALSVQLIVLAPCLLNVRSTVDGASDTRLAIGATGVGGEHPVLLMLREEDSVTN